MVSERMNHVCSGAIRKPVDFDDARSQAALNALAELAEKTQVILFTHHSQVVELSKQLQGSVQVHELGVTA